MKILKRNAKRVMEGGEGSVRIGAGKMIFKPIYMRGGVYSFSDGDPIASAAHTCGKFEPSVFSSKLQRKKIMRSIQSNITEITDPSEYQPYDPKLIDFYPSTNPLQCFDTNPSKTSTSKTTATADDSHEFESLKEVKVHESTEKEESSTSENQIRMTFVTSSGKRLSVIAHDDRSSFEFAWVD